MDSSLELTDNEFEYIKLIMKGHNSSYAVWKWLKNNESEKLNLISYKNVNKRFVKLYKEGIIEEIKTGQNIFGRKDYRLSIKGLEQLIPYLLEHPKEIQTVVQYMDKFELDKNTFGLSLLSKFTDMIQIVNIYEDNTSILFNDSYWTKLVSEKKVSNKTMNIIGKFNTEIQTLINRIDESSDSQQKETELVDEFTQASALIHKNKSVKDLYEELEDTLTHSNRNMKATRLEIHKILNNLKERKMVKDIQDTSNETQKLLDKTITSANEAAKIFMQTADDMKAVPETLGSVLMAPGPSGRKKKH